jgi:hypothetical protein
MYRRTGSASKALTQLLLAFLRCAIEVVRKKKNDPLYSVGGLPYDRGVTMGDTSISRYGEEIA